MEIYLIFPREPIRLENRTILFDTEGDLRRIPPMRGDAEIRIVEYYLDKNKISYVIRDWTEGKKEIVGTKCFFAEDLYK